LPIGLFFLFLEALATFLPWKSNPLGGSVTGLGGSDATLLLFLCLAVGGIAATIFVFKENLRQGAMIGAAFGTFLFFVIMAEISNASRGGRVLVGLWIGLLAALGILGPFVTLAILRPLDWPYLKGLNMPPGAQQYGALMISQGAALLWGILYLLITVTS
jgi:hypothetical protein